MIDKNAVLAKLRLHQEALQQRGVLHAAVFGSVARGEAKEGSDIDILIDINPEIPMDIYAYTNVKQYIADLFPIQTDVINYAALKPGITIQAQKDAVYAF
ncbi:MAG: nucleotidyltransferase domain-containing protein [Crocosphaera sp.]|nr:nucleotidyltransferase domain-containing protein [Crocosphaera sp.]